MEQFFKELQELMKKYDCIQMYSSYDTAEGAVIMFWFPDGEYKCTPEILQSKEIKFIKRSDY